MMLVLSWLEQSRYKSSVWATEISSGKHISQGCQSGMEPTGVDESHSPLRPRISFTTPSRMLLRTIKDQQTTLIPTVRGCTQQHFLILTFLYWTLFTFLTTFCWLVLLLPEIITSMQQNSYFFIMLLFTTILVIRIHKIVLSASPLVFFSFLV